MIRLPEFRRVFRVAFGRRGVDKDIDEEIAFHLDTRTEELIGEGVGPRRARERAEQEFGDARRYRAELRAGGRRKARRVRRVEVFDSLRQDVLFSVRQLWKSKAFTAAAVVTLALGIGATTTIFSVVNAVVLRPLPFHQPDSLVRLYELTPQGRTYTTSEPTLIDWQVMPRSFQGVGAYSFNRIALAGEGEPEWVTGGRVTHNLLPTLGIEPLIGRGFRPEEDRPDPETRVIMLSEGLWERRFGRDPQVVGRTLVVDGQPTTVTGVVRLRGIVLIDFGETLEFLVPLAADPDAPRSNHYITAIGRLAPGISRLQAQQEMDGIARRIGETYPRSNEGWGVHLVPMREWLIGPELGRTVFVLLGAVGLLLLLACANVSNLLVARGTTRLREIGVRAALGASRGRIVRQLLTESFILAALGGAVGIALTYWTMPLVRSFGPGNIPRLDEASVDGTVLLFALATAGITCLLFGLIPAFQAVRGELQEALREGARSVVTGSRIRDLLVIGELALAVVVLIGAGLMGHSFIRLLSVDPGFDAESVHSVKLQLPPSSSAEERVHFFRSLEERIRGLPGVVSVASAFIEPFGNNNTSNRVAAEEWDPQSPDEFIAIDWRSVTPAFFEAMRIPLVRGRFLDSRDGSPFAEGEPLRIAVSESLAETLWPGQDPIDKRLIWRETEGPRFHVVGVVGNIRDVEMGDQRPMLYLLHDAQAWSSMTVMIRLAGDPSGVVPAIRREIRDAAPAMPIPAISPLGESLRRAVATPRFLLQLFGIFAGLALVLGAVGVYAVMMFQVAQRTREIGVRMALGAQRGEVLGMVIRQSAGRMVVGLVIGLGAALGLSRLMESLLYEVTPTDPITYAGVAVLLGCVAILATLIPARQATRVDPKVAFTAE